MCYGMRCRYEIKSGPAVGECKLRGINIPYDAACMVDDYRFNCSECDNGAFTECDGRCLKDE